MHGSTIGRGSARPHNRARQGRCNTRCSRPGGCHMQLCTRVFRLTPIQSCGAHRQHPARRPCGRGRRRWRTRGPPSAAPAWRHGPGRSWLRAAGVRAGACGWDQCGWVGGSGAPGPPPTSPPADGMGGWGPAGRCCLVPHHCGLHPIQRRARACRQRRGADLPGRAPAASPLASSRANGTTRSRAVAMGLGFAAKGALRGGRTGAAARMGPGVLPAGLHACSPQIGI